MDIGSDSSMGHGEGCPKFHAIIPTYAVGGWVGRGVGLCSVYSRKSNAYVMPLPLFRKQLLALLSFAQFTWFFNTTTWLGAALTSEGEGLL